MAGFPHVRGSGDRSDVPGRLDALPLTRLHLLLFAMLGLGLLFDQMEGSMTAVLAAVFSLPGSGVTAAALGNMIFLYYVVGGVGAPAMGFVADRFGRRFALLLAFAGFGALSAIAALILEFDLFATIRVVSALMLTAVPPLVYSYAADVLPPGVRGKMIMLISAMAAIGGMLAPALTHLANPVVPFGLEGWRAVMLGGGVAGVLLWICFRFAPESPRWLAVRGRADEAEAALRRLETSPPIRRAIHSAPIAPAPAGGQVAALPGGLLSAAYRGRLALTVSLTFLQSFGLTGFVVLMTTSLVRKGFDIQGALAISSWVLLAMPVGVVVSSAIIDRFNRRTLFVWMSMVTALTSILFGYATQTWMLLASGGIFAFVMAAYATTIQIYVAEMFPTRLRGTAIGLGYAGVRTGSACVPLVLLPLLLGMGPVTAFTAIAGLLFSAGLLARLFGPEMRPATVLS